MLNGRELTVIFAKVGKEGGGKERGEAMDAAVQGPVMEEEGRGKGRKGRWGEKGEREGKTDRNGLVFLSSNNGSARTTCAREPSENGEGSMSWEGGVDEVGGVMKWMRWGREDG